MKKIITCVLAVGLTTAAAFNQQIVNAIIPEKPVSKEISLAIAKENDYSSRAYDEAVASVHIIITKMNGAKKVIVWDKTFDTLQLKKYPTIANAYEQSIIIPNIFDRKEKLLVEYIITYTEKGSVLKFANETFLLKGQTSGKVIISI